MSTTVPKRSIALLGCALLATGLTTTTATARAEQSGGARHVALGDSYASGAGIPAQSAGLCMRSDQNYGQRVADALGAAHYTDVSCAGAKASALTKPQTDLGVPVNGAQLDAVTPDTTLVTLTIGGNNLGTSDMGFVDVIAACSALSPTDPLGAPCRDLYTDGDGGDTLVARLAAAGSELTAALRRIHTTAPRARVVVVGYPSVIPADPRKCLGKLPITTGDIAYLHGVLGELNDMVARTAAAGGATYVDTVAATRGHDSCSADPWIEGLFPASPALPLHPDATGQRVMADAVLAALGRG
ncbi:SGNH/GDSL hydrolase family protein [Streptomyces sp. NPDC018031]|uniref:SGNH/GDSL hydrolase family protein n=1 Tax=Streptomyces sp. NPDC018031 TaxID=3365033 RepID=UPI0037AF1DD7